MASDIDSLASFAMRQPLCEITTKRTHITRLILSRLLLSSFRDAA